MHKHIEILYYRIHNTVKLCSTSNMEGCKGNINSYCYVCGHFVPVDEWNKNNKRQKCPLSENFKLVYEKYFNQPLIMDANWVPNSVCMACYNGLFKWSNKQRKSMPFGILIIWTDPGGHNPANCYACQNNVTGLNVKKYRI